MNRLLLIPVCFGLIFSACSHKNKNVAPGRKEKPNAPVTAYRAASGTIRQILELPGTLLPMEEVTLHSELSGKITGLYIQEGTFVQAGTLLVKLYDSDLQAQLKKLQIQLQIAQKTEERNRELLQINGLSQQEYDLSYLQVNNLKADIELTKTQITKTEIRAPFSGQLGFRTVSVGAYVTPATLLTTIRQVQTLKLQFTVPEKYAADIKNGQLIHFQTETGEQTFPARVYALETALNETTRGLEVRCRVETSSPTLYAGLFARVVMDFTASRPLVLVPSQALIAQARGKKIILYKSGTAVFTDVTTGARDSAFVEIRTGVTAGDTVITSGLMSLQPGSNVQLSKVVQP